MNPTLEQKPAVEQKPVTALPKEIKPMNYPEAFATVLRIITPFARNAEALKATSDTTRILEDLQVNSARLIDIVLAVEDEFGITIDDSMADQVRTLGDAARMVVQRSGGTC